MEAIVADFQKLQNTFQTAVEARQRLDSQLSENLQVKKEFDSLSADNQIYKLIGPVLVKQEQTEAKSNVDKRIEFIKSEIERVEKQLQELNEKMEKRKVEVSCGARPSNVLPADRSSVLVCREREREREREKADTRKTLRTGTEQIVALQTKAQEAQGSNAAIAA
ncbi:Prefoldin subunit 6 [Thecaphora frezii]